MIAELEGHVKSLAKKAAETQSSVKSLQFSQAAQNLANALATVAAVTPQPKEPTA